MVPEMLEAADGQAMVLGFNPAMLDGRRRLHLHGHRSPRAIPTAHEGVAGVPHARQRLRGRDGERLRRRARPRARRPRAARRTPRQASHQQVLVRRMDHDAHRPRREDPGVAQAMGFIFGPAGGPTGFVAKTESGIYTTFAKNTPLMNAAIGGGQGREEPRHRSHDLPGWRKHGQRPHRRGLHRAQADPRRGAAHARGHVRDGDQAGHRAGRRCPRSGIAMAGNGGTRSSRCSCRRP